MVVVRRPWVAVLLVVGLLAGLVALMVPRVLAAPASISGLKASTVVKASPLEVWYGQMTPAGVCRLIPACTTGTATPGGYRFRLTAGDVTETVKATTLRKARPKLMRLRLASKSSLGSFQGILTIELTKLARHKTRVGVTVVDATASGKIARVLIPLLKKNLAPSLTGTAQDLNTSRKAAGITPHLTLSKPAKKRGKAAVKLSARELSLLKPTAKGKLRVLAGKKVLCTTKLAKSKAHCRFPTPRKGTRITAVATGKLSTGFQVWNDTTGKWSR